MAGFFGFFNYNKEGKGVYPEDLDKGPVPTFFGVLTRKFWKICLINMMYVLFSLPALILAFFGSSFVIQALFPRFSELLLENALAAGAQTAEGVSSQAIEMTLMFLLFGMLLVGMSMVIVGPVHAGIVYLLRNYSREEHAFVWGDFKEHAAANWKQSLASSLISLAVLIVVVVNLTFYGQGDFIKNSMLRTIILTVIVLFYIIWSIMQMYLYPMMVTFDLKLKQLYKNCFFFSILRLPLNLLIFVLSLFVLFIIPAVLIFVNSGISFIFAVFWYLFLAFALNLLLVTFFAYRGIDKYMIKRLQEEENAEPAESAEVEEDEAEESEEAQEEPEEGKSEKAKRDKALSPA